MKAKELLTMFDEKTQEDITFQLSWIDSQLRIKDRQTDIGGTWISKINSTTAIFGYLWIADRYQNLKLGTAVTKYIFTYLKGRKYKKAIATMIVYDAISYDKTVKIFNNLGGVEEGKFYNPNSGNTCSVWSFNLEKYKEK